MIVCICHDYVFVNAQAESMWRVKLSFGWTQLTESDSRLHRDILWVRSNSSAATVDWQRCPWWDRDGWRRPWLMTGMKTKHLVKPVKKMTNMDQSGSERPITSGLNMIRIFHFLSHCMVVFLFLYLFSSPTNPRLECYFHWALDWSPSRTSLETKLAIWIFFVFVFLKITKIQDEEMAKNRLRAPFKRSRGRQWK